MSPPRIPVLDPDAHRFALYRRGRDADHRPATLPVTELGPAERRTVIILPGTRVNHEIPENILKGIMVPNMITYVKDALLRGKMAPDALPDIHCVAYSHNDEQCISDHFSRQLTRQHPTRCGAQAPAGSDVHECVTQVLLPLAGVSATQHPPVAEICRRLSNVTVYGHSFGSVFGQQVAKAMRWHLQEHGYGMLDARRCTRAVQMIALGNMAQIEDDARGFTTHTFAADFDPTTYHTMHRIAIDHRQKLGYTQDTQALQHQYYARCGYDPELAMARAPLPPGARDVTTGRLQHFTVPGGTLTLGDLPDRISWRDGKRSMTQASLDQQCADIDTELAKQGRSLIGLNGEPIARRSNTPPHDVAMFAQPADGNAAMVNAVDEAVLRAVTRAPVIGAATTAAMQAPAPQPMMRA